ncbi:MAG TPA: acyltransferase [Tepidisphaeraceae bacterium]|jgi:peptidoglycan/LPS O-acetylase OafA/YrhL
MSIAPAQIEEPQKAHRVQRLEHLGWVRGGRVPCLDGIRAISILLVIMEHSRETIRPVALKSLLWLFGGHFGVTCFFVISGFLISLLLFREFERGQTISLGGFYARRALRLFPACIAYLLFILVLTHVMARPISWVYWRAALTYTICYVAKLKSFWYLGHTWSLAVEEHFYIFWPILIFFLRPKRAIIAAGIYVALTPAIRFLVWRQHQEWLDIDYVSITQMGSIATGCILGFVVFNYDQWLMRILNGRRAVVLTALSLLALVGSAIMNHMSGKYYLFLGDPAASILVAASMLGIWFTPGGYLHRWLNTPALVGVGILSYSVYLWQQPFTGPDAATWMDRWPQNVLLIFVAAAGSYFIVERPFLKLKARFSGSRNRFAKTTHEHVGELQRRAA